MFAVGLAGLPSGYDQGAQDYWKRRSLEDEQSARTALSNYFSSLLPNSSDSPFTGIPSGPSPGFPPASGAPSAVASLSGGAAAEANAIKAGTWQPAPDYDVGVQIGANVGANPPPGGATMGGAPGAPLGTILPGSPVGPPVPGPVPGAPAAPTAWPRPSAGAAPPGAPSPYPSARPAQAGGGVSRGTGPQTWEQLARAIAQANPGIQPDVLMRAVQQALPLVQTDSRLWYQAMQAELGAARLKAQYDLAGSRQNAITQLMNDFKRNNPYATPEDEANYYRLIQGDPTKMAIAGMRSQPKSPAAIALQKFIEEGDAAGTPRTAQDIQNFTNQPAFLKQDKALTAAEKRQKTGIEAAERRQDKAITAAGERQERGITAAGERQDKALTAAGERTGAQIKSRETIAALNRDQKLEIFNRSQAQKEEQFRERTALAIQKMQQGSPAPDDLDAIAQSIAHYRVNPATALARLNAQARSGILAKVQEINPKWSQSNWKASFDGITRFTTGRQGDAVRFLTVADDHLRTLNALADQLTKASDVRSLRTVVNYISKQMGHPEVTNFETARHFVASEVTRAIVGGPGALGDRIAAEAPLSENASPVQILGSINVYRRLARGQLGGLKAEFERIPGVAPDEWKERFGFEPQDLGPAQETKPAGGIKFNWVTPPAAGP